MDNYEIILVQIHQEEKASSASIFFTTFLSPWFVALLPTEAKSNPVVKLPPSSGN